MVVALPLLLKKCFVALSCANKIIEAKNISKIAIGMFMFINILNIKNK